LQGAGRSCLRVDFLTLTLHFDSFAFQDVLTFLRESGLTPPRTSTTTNTNTHQHQHQHQHQHPPIDSAMTTTMAVQRLEKRSPDEDSRESTSGSVAGRRVKAPRLM